MTTTSKFSRYTLAQMKEANKKAGFHWFDVGTMEFFGSKVVGLPNKFNLFITSETNPEGVTAYTVRQFNHHSHRVHTVSQFHAFSRPDATAFMRGITRALGRMGAREKAIFDNMVCAAPWDGHPDCVEYLGEVDGENRSFVIRPATGEIVN